MKTRRTCAERAEGESSVLQQLHVRGVRPPVENDQAKRGRESAVKLRRSAGFYFRQLRPDGLLVGSERVRTTIEQPIQLSRG
jgi:hypothetical protein